MKLKNLTFLCPYHIFKHSVALCGSWLLGLVIAALGEMAVQGGRGKWLYWIHVGFFAYSNCMYLSCS